MYTTSSTESDSDENTCSTSCVWGSVYNYVDVERFESDSESDSGSLVNVKKHDRLLGSRRFVSKSENESIAQKRNWTEQCKLDTYSKQVQKEKSILERQFRQNARMFRARSAQVLRSRTAHLAKEPDTHQHSRSRRSEYKHDKGKMTKATPTSTYMPGNSPSRIGSTRNAQEEEEVSPACGTCTQIQGVVGLYETEGKKAGMLDDDVQYAICHFSDTQLKTFLNMLETKYFNEIPELSDILQHNRSLLVLGQPALKVPSANFGESGRKTSNVRFQARPMSCPAPDSIQDRIRKFCVKQDEFNVETPVPYEIKQKTENIRLGQATCLLTSKQTPVPARQFKSQRAAMLDEVKIKLGMTSLDSSRTPTPQQLTTPQKQQSETKTTTVSKSKGLARSRSKRRIPDMLSRIRPHTD
jgi:hypothetical protein